MNTKLILGFMALMALLVSIPSSAEAYPIKGWHPARREVLGRDRAIRNELYADRGHLGGHYNQLMREDHTIRRQEQRDARMNGGHLTRAEDRRLNHEENRLQRQINHDQRYW
ncbi:MAG: hypothetical protein K2X81_04035 [Candidatus Obscuribacterales bacterium]|nr:hypothetical protein [Candidatus Obscuribacterales bacterium]